MIREDGTGQEARRGLYSFGRGGRPRPLRITAARGAINGLMAEVLEEHVREYLIEPRHDDAVSRDDAAEELIEIIHSYLT